MKIPKRTLRSGGIQGSRATRWIFVGPAMLVVICLLIYPLLSTLMYSFTNKTMIRNDFDVVGLQNYIDILTDGDFYSAFGHTLLWTLFSVLGQLIVGFIGALALNRVQNKVAKNLFRIFAIIPWAFPAIATAMTWKWLLNGIHGFVPTLLRDLGITPELIQFLSDKNLVLPTLIFINIWFGAPLILVNVYAALQTIPQDQYEAAQIDGASSWQSFRYVTAPHIRTVVGLLVVLRTVWVFNNFDIIFMITGGGPAGASTTMPSTSKVAGKKHMRMAGRPARRRSSRSRLSPARVRMMTRASCRRSAEMPSRLGDSRLSTQGPSRMPASSIPTREGSRNLVARVPSTRPSSSTKPKLVNIKPFLSGGGHKKSQCPLQMFAEVISQTAVRANAPGGPHPRIPGEVYHRPRPLSTGGKGSMIKQRMTIGRQL